MKILVNVRGFTVEISNYPAFLNFYDHIYRVNFLLGFSISKLKIRVEFIEVLKEFFLIFLAVPDICL